MKVRHILMAGALVLAVAGEGRANFVLNGVEHLDVTSYHSTGVLWDFTTADVKNGGSINNAYVNDDAVLTVSGGTVSDHVYAYNTSDVVVSSGYVNIMKAYDTSSVDISGGNFSALSAYHTISVAVSGGSLNTLVAYNTTSVIISGGSLSTLDAYNTTNVVISGGSIRNRVSAYDTSVVTFHGYDFRATAGLTLDGETVLGTGILTGKWFDGTSWIIPISNHEPGATILAVPEPATLSLLALGSLVALRRRRR